jgi:hypothetical protein
MPLIIETLEPDFVPAPEGTFPAVIVDVEDAGEMANRFQPEEGPQRKLRVTWLLPERTPDGRPLLATKLYNWKLREGSNLRNDAEVLMGPLSPAQVRRFDAEWLIGKPSLVSVFHNKKSDRKVFANVDTVLPLPKNMTAPRPDGYVRKIDRLMSAPRKSGASTAGGNPGSAAGEEDPTAPDETMRDRESSERDDKWESSQWK